MLVGRVGKGAEGPFMALDPPPLARAVGTFTFSHLGVRPPT